MREVKDLKIGDTLYAYSINYGWGLSAEAIEFIITRETEKLWILTWRDEEYQKIRKDDLSIYGKYGVSVVTSKDPIREQAVKDINEYKELKSRLDTLNKKINKYPINKLHKGVLEYLRAMDKAKGI